MNANIEDYSEQGKMIAHVLIDGRHVHGVLSDEARAAILDALSEITDAPSDANGSASAQ